MKEQPILFSGPMVRAILDGRKTQTRRVLKPQPTIRDGFVYGMPSGGSVAFLRREPWLFSAPRYRPGMQLWVRETWLPCHECGCPNHAATLNKPRNCKACDEYLGGPLKPSIFMPRHASRITLEIESVRVERVQEISAEDADREGCGCGVNDATGGPVARFKKLWDSINGKRPQLPVNTQSKRYQRVKRWLDRHPPIAWSDNPLVWVVQFRRIEQ